METIISVIAKDSPTEKVRQELDMLTDVHTCIRKGDEQPADFVSRFKGAVARYVNHTAGIDESTSRQFAVMLIRNAQLTADNANTVSLQLVMLSQAKEKAVKTVRIELPLQSVTELTKTSSISEASSSEGTTELKKDVRISVRSALDAAVKKAASAVNVDTVMFSLDEAIDAVAQVKLELSDIAHARGSMLGKHTAADAHMEDRRTADIKSRTRCRACKKIGHWFQDRE